MHGSVLHAILAGGVVSRSIKIIAIKLQIIVNHHSTYIVLALQTVTFTSRESMGVRCGIIVRVACLLLFACMCYVLAHRYVYSEITRRTGKKPVVSVDLDRMTAVYMCDHA